MEESICDALCEVIERDAVNMVYLCASSTPYTILKKIKNSLKKDGYPVTQILAEDKFIDDPAIFIDIYIFLRLQEFEHVKFLVKRLIDTKIPLLMIKNMTKKDIGIPTFVASSIEWINHNYNYFAKGYEAHPDARIALISVITEVSQTRDGNI